MKKKIENLKKNETIQIISWWSISFAIQFLILHHLNFGWFYSFVDAFVSNFLLLFFTFILKLILNYYQSKNIISISNIAFIGSFSYIHLAISHFVISSVFKKDISFEFGYNHDAIYRFLLIYFLLFLTFYQLWIDKFKKVQESTTQKLIEIERQLNNAELKNIQQQLQPHFLFNSLNSISALTVVKPEEARRMVHLLSDFLRGTLSREKEQLMPLTEEINYLNLYLEIEKVRFGHRLQVEFQIDEQCNQAKLPSLILQPIVENAIKYGLYGQTEGVTIRIHSICENNQLKISISNPYTLESEKTSKGLGFGLSSIQRKLYLLYGQKDLLIIDKTETQFTTKLIIPQG